MRFNEVIAMGFHAVEDYCQKVLMVTWESLWNIGNLETNIRINLLKVYLSLFLVSLSSAFGFCLYLVYWGTIVVGFFAVLLSGCMFSLDLHPTGQPGRERARVSLLIAAAFFLGAFSGLVIDLFIKIDSSIIVSALVATPAVFCCYALAPLMAEARCCIYCYGLIFSTLLVLMLWRYAPLIFGTVAALKGFWLALRFVYFLWLILYVVVYSQEIIEEVRAGGNQYYHYSEVALAFLIQIPIVHVHVFILMLRRAFLGERNDAYAIVS